MLAPMVVPYTLLALSIGVLCSVLLRRTLPAIALAAALCIGVGVLDSHAAATALPTGCGRPTPRQRSSTSPSAPNPLFLVDNTVG